MGVASILCTVGALWWVLPWLKMRSLKPGMLIESVGSSMRLAYCESLQDALTFLTVRTAPLLPAARSTWMRATKEQDTVLFSCAVGV